MSSTATFSSSASAVHSASDLHEQPSKRARLHHSEDDAVAAAVHEAVQATLDSSAAAVSGNKRDWEHGLSSLISDYAAPTLAYHVLCSDAMEPDVSSFDTAHAMLRHLRGRYNKEESSSGASEAERSVAEVEAECVKLLRHHDRKVTAAQEKALDKSDRDAPYDEEIAALHAQRITLEGQEEGKEEEEEKDTEGEEGGSEQWSVSSSLPLSTSLSPLQPPFVLFEQSNLSWRARERELWEVHCFDSAEQLTTHLRANSSGCHRGPSNADGEGLSLADLLRRALHLSRIGRRGRGGSCYLAAVFHRARTVWYVHGGGKSDDDDDDDDDDSDSGDSDESSDVEDNEGGSEETDESIVG